MRQDEKKSFSKHFKSWHDMLESTKESKSSFKEGEVYLLPFYRKFALLTIAKCSWKGLIAE
jgi:hypothetical protein